MSADRILVVGLGIEGVALTRYFAARGATVTVNDARTADQLSGRLTELRGTSFDTAFGGHDPALVRNADAVYVSQGVPLSLPLIAEARRRGITVGSVATLLYDICPGKIVAITGSAGKTTTTSLVASIIARGGLPSVLAGNIGRWPLADLERVTPDTWVVVEISHTQLQLVTRSPHIACVTNVTPNHLDQFSWDDYVDLKRNHVRYQTPLDTAVLNLDDPITRGFRRDTPGDVLYFSMSGDTPGDGTFIRVGGTFNSPAQSADEERVIWRRHGQEMDVLGVDSIALRGRHNVENVIAATAVAGACGIPMETVAEAVRNFTGVPHRLEIVATINGVHYVNDSIATAPERTLAGMRSFSEPLLLLLGGREKKLPLEDLAAEAARRCRAVLCFGEAGEIFASAMRNSTVNTTTIVERLDTLEDAVDRAATLAHPGDVVLLAPAGTSFDSYPNFERRGEHFRDLVMSLAANPPRAVHSQQSSVMEGS